MGAAVANGRASLPPTVRYARAFNTLGGENLADPVFADGKADMFFSAPEADRTTVEAVIEDVGLRPVYVGEDQELLIDNLFQLWIALAVTQGRGRRLAFRLLESLSYDRPSADSLADASRSASALRVRSCFRIMTRSPAGKRCRWTSPSGPGGTATVSLATRRLRAAEPGETR